MTDIVERLRKWCSDPLDYRICSEPIGPMAKDIHEAADEIERLRAENEELKAYKSRANKKSPARRRGKACPN